MRLVSYNIQFSRGRDGRYDLARCIGEVAEADIIALQEVERHWARTGMADQPAEIGALLPGHYWVYGPSFDVHGGGGPADNRRRQFGDMLLSRWPILSSRLIALPKAHHDDRFNMHMGALEGVIAAPSGALRVWSIHLGYLEPAERLEQLRVLIEVQRRGREERGAWSGPGAIGTDDWAGGDGEPPMPDATVWLGDFNMTPGSAEHGLVTGAGLVDAWAAAGAGPDDGVTYYGHPGAGAQPGWRIDYGFLSADLVPRLERCGVDRVARGSDHQPVWLELAD